MEMGIVAVVITIIIIILSLSLSLSLTSWFASQVGGTQGKQPITKKQLPWWLSW